MIPTNLSTRRLITRSRERKATSGSIIANVS